MLAGGSRIPDGGAERARDDGVPLGPCAQAAQVRVDRAHAQRPAAFDLRQREVGADRHLPGVVDRLGRCAEEAPRQLALAAFEALAQRDRLGRRDRHALAVGRVERADRVARHEQPAGEAAQALVAAPHARREAVRRDVVERLGGGDRVEHVRRRDRRGEGGEGVRIVRRAVRGAVAAEREDPAAALLCEQEQRARALGDGADQDQLVGIERAVRQPQVPARVAHADRELLLRRACVAEPLEPRRQPRRSPARRDHEVGREELLRAAVAALQDPHARDPVAVRPRRQPKRVAAVDQLHARERPHAAADVALDEGSAREQRVRARRGAREPVAADDEARLRERLAGRRAGGHELLAESGQQRVEAGLAVRQQRMRMAALRDRLAPLEAGRKDVALEHRHALVGVHQRARREQPGDAAADHHRVLSDPSHQRHLLVVGSRASLRRVVVEFPGELLPSRCSAAVQLALPEPLRDALDAAREVSPVGAERQPEQLRRRLLRRRRAHIGALERAHELRVARVGAQRLDRLLHERAQRIRRGALAVAQQARALQRVRGERARVTERAQRVPDRGGELGLGERQRLAVVGDGSRRAAELALRHRVEPLGPALAAPVAGVDAVAASAEPRSRHRARARSRCGPSSARWRRGRRRRCSTRTAGCA